MNEELKNLLKELSETPGPSGNEELVKSYVAQKIIDYSDSLVEDPIGNLISKIGSGNYKIGVLSHLDEVGMIVTKLNANGTIGFSIVGMIDARNLQGCMVDIISTDGDIIPGLIGAKSRHLITKQELAAPINEKLLSIDIGARSKEEIKSYNIEVGCGIVFKTPVHFYENGVVMAKALDNRIGCAVLIQTLRNLKNRLNNTSLYGMFTVQEEIGAKGAAVVAYDYDLNLTISLDNVPVKNIEDIKEDDTDLGKGPVIRIFDWWPDNTFGMFTNKKIKEKLIQVAEKNKIRYQIDVLTSTYLDSSQVHLTGPGIASGSICFPRRYSHSPVESCHIQDIEYGIKLLTEFILAIDHESLSFKTVYK